MDPEDIKRILPLTLQKWMMAHFAHKFFTFSLEDRSVDDGVLTAEGLARICARPEISMIVISQVFQAEWHVRYERATGRIEALQLTRMK